MRVSYKYLVFCLSLVVVLIWVAAVSYPSPDLRVIACSVGQGDAILITKGQSQILVDGGPNNKVLECLGRHIPFWDRKIELVIVTHPDKDHYFGIIQTLAEYNVEVLIANKIDKEGSEYAEFKNSALKEGARILNPHVGLQVNVEGINLDFLWPDEDFLNQSKLVTASNSGSQVLGVYTTNASSNDFSSVFKLSYGSFDALFTGDIGPKISDELALRGYATDIEYLKVPHHGSKNGLTRRLLDSLDPEISVISLGKNSYGHPHDEVMQMLVQSSSKVSRTDKGLDVIVETNGNSWWVK